MDRADVTWLNTDWSEWTHYTYSTLHINLLEKRFLNDMKFNLYISPCNYSNFVSYLEFKLHSRQLLLCGNISYRDIDVLSQSLKPEYIKRLKLNLRPFEAMILLLKQAASILAIYSVTLAAVYIINHREEIIPTQFLCETNPFIKHIITC